MLRFFARRLASLIFVLFSITFLTFIVGYLAPGDPVQAIMGSRRDPATYDRLKREYGLDRPWIEQYGSYITGVMCGDLGKLYRYAGRPVWDLVKQGVGTSAMLGLVALAVSLTLGLPIGVAAAARAGGLFDRLSMIAMLAIFSIPSFVLAGVLQIAQVALFKAGLPSLPTSGWGDLKFWVLPVVVLSAASTGYMARLTRSTVLETLDQDYIRTAKAKGASTRRVLLRHALRNALIPIVTVLGPSVAFVVVGSFVVENVFRVPGVGFIAVQSIGTRDYPVIQSVTLLLALAVVLMNLLADAAYTVLDPRIRTE